MESINWEEVSAKLPSSKTDPDQKAKRKKMWRDIDSNGNGYASLAEIDKGVRDVICLDEVFDAKPAIMRAFQVSKNAVPGGKYGEDYIEWREFRIFLSALR